MPNHDVSRRSFFRAAGTGAAAFTIIQPELVRGAGDERLKAGLIGCGDRGTQAVQNLFTGCPNVELVAMADLFEDRLARSLGKLAALPPELASRVKADPEHRFVGFDAYKQVIASDVDIIMLATTPAYRP
ncbi:MAG: gfo/Idh/MocA family oxidoreductase, partial [Bryobacteraceae bacterium]